MDFDYFKMAVDSLKGTDCMVGMTGGDPILSPDFERMCEYLRSKFPWKQCGLWSCFPKGKEHLADAVCATFGNVFLNDHSRGDVLHAPILVSADEVVKDRADLWYLVDHCWIQHFWSASINPHGAFFCEIAASLSMLVGLPHDGWVIEDPSKQWWAKSTLDYSLQMRQWCPSCGGALQLKKRYSVEGIDDLSPWWYEQLKDTSPKIKAGKYVLHDLQICMDTRQMATYKDLDYRARIAERYGIFLVIDNRGFWEPHLKTIERRMQQ